MPTCFVIQPFDDGKYDKRYSDIFKPAIKAAGLDSYRVDEDISVEIPIEDIEKGIRNADICFAEISTDNPNVWFELGFAISAQKDVVMVCSSERKEKFPFDVQHRSIIKYHCDSPSDFNQLKLDITAKLVAVLKKNEGIQHLAQSVVQNVEGLPAHEMYALATLAENVDFAEAKVNTATIQKDMEKSGFTKLATMLGLQSLVRAGYITQDFETQQGGWGEEFAVFSIEKKGWEWLDQNRDRFILRA